jgi:hypothetical protein
VISYRERYWTSNPVKYIIGFKFYKNIQISDVSKTAHGRHLLTKVIRAEGADTIH